MKKRAVKMIVGFGFFPDLGPGQEINDKTIIFPDP
jgi:hypothetical protein